MNQRQDTNPGFEYSHAAAGLCERRLEKFFSLVPGLLSWSLLIGMLALSLASPLYGAVAVIAFHIYWLFRLFYMTLFLVIAYVILSIERDMDWIARCRTLQEGENGLRKLKRRMRAIRKPLNLGYWFVLLNQKRELRRVLRNKIRLPDFDGIYHLVIVTVTNETREILEPGLRAMTRSQFPSRRILPVLAMEGRFGAAQVEMAEALRQEYGSSFFQMLVTVHPADIPGEARVKGANATFAARTAVGLLEKQSIPLENVIVSCFDADTVPGPNYFAALTYHFMRHPVRLRASYQPIPVYDNNIWEASGFARVLEMGSSFFQLIEATNPEKLVTFSSHSMSLKALVEIGYWPVDMVSDDSAIFWKALVHYRGDYRVVPLYVSLSMDAVVAETLPETLNNIYRQKRRWAWGIENFPIVMRAFLQDRAMPWVRKVRYACKLLEMNVSWATVGFIVTFIGWLPAIFASREFSDTVLYYNSAKITALIFNLAFSAILVMAVLAYLLMPKTRTRNPFFQRILFALEWLLVPFVYTFLSALPALDAQTRLMTGREFGFRITRKIHSKKP